MRKRNKQTGVEFPEKVKRAFMKSASLPVGLVAVAIVVMLSSVFIGLHAVRDRDRAWDSVKYYQARHEIALDEDQIQSMTAKESYDYAVKMFNVDFGRNGYNDIKAIAMILSFGIELGVIFHGFKLVSVRRNG